MTRLTPGLSEPRRMLEVMLQITYDVGKGGFVLRDASSTNGTWVRLRETRVPLATNDELLVGSIRFLCTATETIVERDL